MNPIRYQTLPPTPNLASKSRMTPVYGADKAPVKQFLAMAPIPSRKPFATQHMVTTRCRARPAACDHDSVSPNCDRGRGRTGLTAGPSAAIVFQSVCSRSAIRSGGCREQRTESPAPARGRLVERSVCCHPRRCACVPRACGRGICRRSSDGSDDFSRCERGGCREESERTKRATMERLAMGAPGPRLLLVHGRVLSRTAAAKVPPVVQCGGRPAVALDGSGVASSPPQSFGRRNGRPAYHDPEACSATIVRRTDHRNDHTRNTGDLLRTESRAGEHEHARGDRPQGVLFEIADRVAQTVREGLGAAGAECHHSGGQVPYRDCHRRHQRRQDRGNLPLASRTVGIAVRIVAMIRVQSGRPMLPRSAAPGISPSNVCSDSKGSGPAKPTPAPVLLDDTSTIARQP
jgi:hypothetical protein